MRLLAYYEIFAIDVPDDPEDAQKALRKERAELIDTFGQRPGFVE